MAAAAPAPLPAPVPAAAHGLGPGPHLVAAPSGGVPQNFAPWLDALGVEFRGDKSYVYLITISRVLLQRLPAGHYQDVTTLSKEQVLMAVWDAFEKPLASARGGRPRTRQGHFVMKMVVYRELHSDGTPHFHVAVLLAWECRWAAVKRTLAIRHKLPSHFRDCYTRWCGAVSYGHIATPAKPIVDDDQLLWVPGRSWRRSLPNAGPPPFDLFSSWTSMRWSWPRTCRPSLLSCATCRTTGRSL